MRPLLDTHLILWWLANNPSLPSAPVQTSDRAEGELRGTAPASGLRGTLAAESFESLPLTAAQARQVALLPWHHRDPFDSMLVAQAPAENLILLTAEDLVTAYGDFVRLVR